MESFISFLFFISFVIFVHELGHFLAARSCGVHVDVFSIGFGKPFISFRDRWGTKWQFCWILLGGFVKMRGMVYPGQKKVQENKNPNAFINKTLLQRAWIVFAGPLANFVLAILIFTAIYTYQGYPVSEPIITGIDRNSPADKYGFEIGDHIVKVQGKNIDNFEKVKKIIAQNPGKKLQFSVWRGEDQLDITAQIAWRTFQDNDGNTYKIGYLGLLAGKVHYDTIGLFPAFMRATYSTFRLLKENAILITHLFTDSDALNEIGGFIKIAQYSAKFYASGWINFFFFVAIISINIGMLNLLPIPPLDGGHLFIYMIEALIGRSLPEKFLLIFFKFGFFLLLFFFLWTFFHDLGFGA